MVYNGKLDFNYRYSESDIINNGTLTSIGEMFRSYSIDTRDTRLDPPGCSEFQNMNYRISTNFQIIYLRQNYYRDIDKSIKWKYECSISQKLNNNILKSHKELKRKFNDYGLYSKYNLSFIINDKKYILTNSSTMGFEHAITCKECINSETKKVIFRSGDICKDLDTSFPKWEKVKNEYLENL